MGFFNKVIKTLTISVIGMIGWTGCSDINQVQREIDTFKKVNPTSSMTETSVPINNDNVIIPAGFGKTPMERGTGVNYYEVMGEATFDETCNINPGDYHYTGVLLNGQVGTTCTIFNKSELVERVDPKENPAGYSYEETSIPYFTIYAPVVKKTELPKEAYHGAFYNRSHLISASLGGSPYNENLITGTRMQNVGENNKGGMRYTESIAEDYIRSGQAVNCPLTYSVTPHYTDTSDIMPTWVEVNMANCDNTINTKVATFNDANSYTIDYTTGSFTKN